MGVPSLSTGTLSAPVVLPTKRTMKSRMGTAHVALSMPSWTQPWGAPLSFVIMSASVRVPTKSIASIGPRLTVHSAPSIC